MFYSLCFGEHLFISINVEQKSLKVNYSKHGLNFFRLNLSFYTQLLSNFYNKVYQYPTTLIKLNCT